MFLCMSRQQLVLLQHCNVPPRPVVPVLYSGCGIVDTIAAHTVLHSAQYCTSCALHATITDFVDIHRRWIFLSDIDKECNECIYFKQNQSSSPMLYLCVIILCSDASRS